MLRAWQCGTLRPRKLSSPSETIQPSASLFSKGVTYVRQGGTMADFIFRVDTVQLSDAQQEKIAAAIRGAVLTELAKLDLQDEASETKAEAPAAAGPIESFLFSPIHWHGGIMIPPGEVGAALESN